jgi:hypothetical protein
MKYKALDGMWRQRSGTPTEKLENRKLTTNKQVKYENISFKY